MTKPCKPYRSILDAILDGVDVHASRTSLEAHAEVCVACQSALRESLALRSVLDTLVDGQPTQIDDAAFVDSVFAEIDRDEAAQEIAGAAPAVHLARGSQRWSLALVGSVAAAGIAVVAVEFSAWRDRAPGAPAHEQSGDESAAVAGPKEPKISQATGAPEQPVETESVALTPEEIDGFRMALLEGAEATAFNPDVQDASEDFVAAIASPLHDPRRAARTILTADEEPPRSRALAARFLGPRADARDRVLLKRSISSLGTASAWALVDRGQPGIAALWALGIMNEDSDPAPGSPASPVGSADAARSTLLAAAKAGRLDLTSLPQGHGDAALAAAVISAGASDPASQLLDRFLGSGESPSLDAWIESEGALASLSPVLVASRGARISDRRAKRILQAIEQSGSKDGISFALRAMESSIEGSVEALVAIQGDAPVEALLAATQSSSLRDATEEAAWRAMVRSGAGRVLRTTIGSRHGAGDRAAAVLDALVRCAGDPLHPEEQKVLGGLSASHEVYSDARSDALLLLAERCGRDGAKLLPEVSKMVERLRSDPDAMVSGAAWLVPTQARATVPPYVAAVLSRGSSLAVKHARLTRAIGKARARLAEGSY